MVDPTSRDSDAEWLEALRADVRSLAVAEALSDVPDPGNGSVVTWVKRETRGDTETETVFVLIGRLVHRLIGDVVPEEKDPSWNGTSKCAYDVLVISTESNYRVRFERGRDGAACWSKRWWTFELNPDETGLEIEYSSGTESKQTRGPNPTAFAHALVAAIVRERSEADA